MEKLILPLALTAFAICAAFAGIHAADGALAITPSNLVGPPSPHPHGDLTQDVLYDSRVDPWYVELRELTETLSDAYADKPHLSRFGGTSGENESARWERLGRFTRDVLGAVRSRAGELAQFGPDAAWGYAATMVWIAHRETRIASEPKLLGDQDQGRAHGYWQVWEWHGADPFMASTALDMLIEEPGSSWSLPKGHPWLGYPECARWLATHPAP
jgi:hypothetical protein